MLRYAETDYKFNVTSTLEVDYEYQGNVYLPNGTYLIRGWIDTFALDYLRCW